MDTSRWMELLDAKINISQKPLNTIIIPGAHDSGSYAITPHSEPTPLASNVLKAAAAVHLDAVKDWAKSQNFGLADQFIRGIRYFDLRVYEKTQSEFWLHHSFYSAPLLSELHALRSLVCDPKHAKEIVILDIPLAGGDYISATGHKALLDLISETFGGYIPDSRSGIKFNPSTKLVDFWTSNCNVVILYKDVVQNLGPNSAWFVWDRNDTLRSTWHNKQNFSDLREKLYSELTQPLPANQLCVLQAVLTPDNAMIAKSFMPITQPSWYRSLHDIASDVNPKISKMIEEIISSSKGSNHPNIVMVDFFDVSSTVADCINWNLKLAQK